METPVIMQASDIISSVSLIFVLIGGGFALYRYLKSAAIQRASYVDSLVERLRQDAELREIFYIFEYNKPWYGSFFHGSDIPETWELERKVDKTLAFYSYICYLLRKRMIEKAEFNFFAYQIRRTLENWEVLDYLYNLYHFAACNGVKSTFNELIEYGKKNKYLPTDFFDKKACTCHIIFHHYLNFQLAES